MICNKKQLSEIIGKSEVTLTQWQKDGMPFATKRGRENSYDTVKVIDWMTVRNSREEGDIDPIQARARKDDEMGKRYEMENRVRRDELLEIEDVRETWTGHVTSTKTALRGLPAKLAPHLAVESEPNAISELLLAGIDEALEELADEGK